MFFGGYRGKEAQANLTKISDFFPRIRIFGNILSVEMFGRILRSVYKELHADHETGAADNK